MSTDEQNQVWREHLPTLIADGVLTPDEDRTMSDETYTAEKCPDCPHEKAAHSARVDRLNECLECSCGHGADTNTYQRRHLENRP